MTKADAARLVAIVVTAYPNFDKFKDAKAPDASLPHGTYKRTRASGATAPPVQIRRKP